MTKFLVHFDVVEDYIALETAFASAISVRAVMQAISSEYFDDQFKVEFVEHASAPGSLKKYIGFVVKGVTSGSVFTLALIQFLDSQAVQEISRELIGITPTEAILNKIRALSDQSETHELESQVLIEELLRDTTSAVLEHRGPISLPSSASPFLRNTLHNAQGYFFYALRDDPYVMGVGFSERDEFPIQRSLIESFVFRRRDQSESTLEITPEWLSKLTPEEFKRFVMSIMEPLGLRENEIALALGYRVGVDLDDAMKFMARSGSSDLALRLNLIFRLTKSLSPVYPSAEQIGAWIRSPGFFGHSEAPIKFITGGNIKHLIDLVSEVELSLGGGSRF